MESAVCDERVLGQLAMPLRLSAMLLVYVGDLYPL